MVRIVKCDDGVARCQWCVATAQYQAYHDEEWGFPVDDDQALFEKLMLEAFQSGLAWRTILEKRAGFRHAFKGFEIRTVAAFGDTDIRRLLDDTAIVRHRGKIEATINNARCALELIEERGSLAAHFWAYAPAARAPRADASTAESTALSKDLKKRGWKFVGPTTIHSFMQAVGMVNDHAKACDAYAAVEQARKAFYRSRPGLAQDTRSAHRRTLRGWS